MLAFMIWAGGGCLFLVFGITSFFSKKEVSFWANVRTLPMKDVKGYNRAVGKLWLVFGVVFILLGLPLLAGQNSGLATISILGALVEAIAAMAVYLVVIQGKYEKK